MTCDLKSWRLGESSLRMVYLLHPIVAQMWIRRSSVYEFRRVYLGVFRILNLRLIICTQHHGLQTRQAPSFAESFMHRLLLWANFFISGSMLDGSTATVWRSSGSLKHVIESGGPLTQFPSKANRLGNLCPTAASLWTGNTLLFEQ